MQPRGSTPDENTLEHQLQDKLRNARIPGVNNLAERRGILDVSRRSLPLSMVERVEHLVAELEFESLANLKILENADVEIVDARSLQDVAAAVPSTRDRGWWKNKRRQIPVAVERSLLLGRFPSAMRSGRALHAVAQ